MSHVPKKKSSKKKKKSLKVNQEVELKPGVVQISPTSEDILENDTATNTKESNMASPSGSKKKASWQRKFRAAPIPQIELDAAKSIDLLETPSEFRGRSNSEVQPDIAVMQSQRFDRINIPLIQDYSGQRPKYQLEYVELPDDEYQKEFNEPGEVFIYNFETFKNTTPRVGTRLDVKALIDTLGRLKFNITANRIYNDLTTEELKATIRTATSSFKDVNCLMVFFMTHGEVDNTLHTYDGKIFVEDIIEAFECDALNGVPKWFTFLACKESKNPVVDKKILSEKTFQKPLPNDVIVYYSTTEGNVSARVPNEGTWFIQELCRNLLAYGRRDELIHILTRTNKCVANNYVAVNLKEHRQSPVIVSTLEKKFFLTNSKERLAQLAINEKIMDILNADKK